MSKILSKVSDILLIMLVGIICTFSYSQHAKACDTSQCSVSILPTTNQTVAIASGTWTTAAIWNTGVIPGPNANVVIPTGISVTYNRNTPIVNGPMKSVLVQGTLNFAPSLHTTFIVDTLVVDSAGTLNIGTSTSPIASNRVARVIFAGGDLDPVSDPQLKGRGLLNHGTININGVTKTPYVAAGGTGEVTGSVISLQSAPVGWAVGDSVLVTGSEYVELPVQSTQVTSADYETHDEVRTISAISGNTVTLSSALGSLRLDGSPNRHQRIHPGMEIYIANMTRNVQFTTSTANIGLNHRRGHTMFMSSPNVSINNAAFIDLGRSDKSFPLTARFANGVVPGSNPVITTTGSSTQFDSNMRGRYPVHFHKVGQSQTTPITFTGNVILRSPGWGVSLHSSHADISGNVSYDIFSSHFVTEDGDERGHIDHNLAVKAVGDTVDDFQVITMGQPPESLERKISKGYFAADYTYAPDGSISAITRIQDDGQVGNCFWMQSRNIALSDNLANSCSRVGFIFFHRHVESTPTLYTNLASPHRDLMKWNKKFSNMADPLFERNEVPLVGVANNQATASKSAFSVIKANNEQHHNVFSHITGIRGFNTGSGCVEFGYTGKYLVEDTECWATPGATNVYDVGIDTNNAVENIIFNGFKIVGWDYPMDSNKQFQGVPNPPALTFINGSVQLKTGGLVPFDPAIHLWEFNKFPRVSVYFPDIHKVVPYNSNMAEGSGFTPTLTEQNFPVLNISTSGWWGPDYQWTAKVTDSAGVAPFSLPGAPYGLNYTVHSFESRIPGNTVRARWLEQVNGVFVNRVLKPDGSTCLDMVDHVMDRVNRSVQELDICIPVIGF